jgi:kinesin family member 11
VSATWVCFLINLVRASFNHVDIQLTFWAERKGSVLSSNLQAVVRHGQTLSSVSGNIQETLEQFVQSTTNIVQKLQTRTQSFRASNPSLDELSRSIRSRIAAMNEHSNVIAQANASEDEAIGSLQRSLEDGLSLFSQDLKIAERELVEGCQSQIDAVKESNSSAFREADQAIESIGNFLETLLKNTLDFITTERHQVTEVHTVASDTVKSELERLRQQNIALTKMLQDQQKESERAKEDLQQQLHVLLGDFVANRDASLRRAVGKVQKENESAQADIKTFGERHAKLMDAMHKGQTSTGSELKHRGESMKRTRDGALKVRIQYH